VPFLQLAVASKADYSVTGDRGLLALARRVAHPIVTADWFLITLGKAP
jgi:predicted nucleic acid-binding protein